MSDQKKSSSLIYPFIVILLALLFCLPFFHKGYFETDDGFWALVRQSEMVREIKDGQIPPRWSDYLNHGYGYPLFNFTYPFPYYAGLVPKLAHVSTVVTVKSLFVISVILSGIFIYYLGLKLTTGFGGLIASVFYISAPYRMLDLYKRGSLGESLSFALFPLIFLMTLIHLQRPGKLKFVLLSLLLAVQFLTHNVMALLFIPLWFIFSVILSLDAKSGLKNPFTQILKIFLLSFALSAYFVIPSLFEKKLIYLSQISLTDRNNYFYSLYDLFGNIGWPVVLAILIAVFIVIKNLKSEKSRVTVVYRFLLFVILVFSLFTLKISNFFWSLPLLNAVDFPWRVMGIVMFASSLMASFISVKKTWVPVAIVLAAIGLYTSFTGIPRLKYSDWKDDFIATNDATTTSKDELLPLVAKIKPDSRYLSKVEVINGSADISDLRYNSRSLNFNLHAVSSGNLVINTIYYPGWQFKLNGKILPVGIGKDTGTMLLLYPSGNNIVSGKFNETPLRLASDMISIMAVLYIIYFIYAGKI